MGSLQGALACGDLGWVRPEACDLSTSGPNVAPLAFCSRAEMRERRLFAPIIQEALPTLKEYARGFCSY